ncbi:APC family permease [Nocardioides halotolerans]|uniref:APC family permease n=1 Tax=Nocardioides halotolerans TaxID=433660 RepID=UPI0006844506|nr:amino acid permease [Nocardioides halotolerans]
MTSLATPAAPADPTSVAGGRLDVSQGAALTIGAVLGTGVISLPALAVHEAGPASLLAWALLLLLSVPLATTFAALGARYPDGGGVSTYARQAFGARAATVVGWCFYFAIPIGAPTAAGFAGAYVADSAGGGRQTQLVATGGIIALVTAMNWFGLRVSGRVQLVIAFVLGGLLLVATVVSLPHAELGNLTPFAPHGWLAIGPAAALLVWAFAGWEAVTSLSGEYRNPGRDIGRATGIAIAVISVLYLGIAFATVAVLGDHPGKAPLSDLLVLGFGEWARPVTAVVAVLLSVGAINAYFAGGARLGAALARDGSLPVWLARGSTAGEVPRRSLGVVALGGFASLGVITAGDLSLNAPLLMTTGAFALVYAVGTAAALRLLPPRTWVRRGAGVGFVATLGLLALTGTDLLGPALIGAGAVAWTALHPAPRQVAPTPA